MKKLYLPILVVSMTMLLSLDASAFSGQNLRKRDGCRCPRHNPVSAPLDGGLLAILGAAGVAYYIARKKKAKE